MPDNSRSTPPNGQVSTGELNFVQPVADQPRMKRRSLKPKPVTAATPLPDEPRKEEPIAPATPSAASRPATPGVVIHPQSHAPAPSAATSPTATSSPAASSRPAQPSYRPSAPTPNPSSNPNPYRSTVAPASSPLHSSAARKEPEDAPSMKSTSPAASSSSSTHTSSFAPRASSSSTTGAPLRSGSVTDYRANIERQAREQKSIGGIINYVVYALAAFLILCATLAGYGAYVLSKQIQHQSVTLSDLDTRYTQANRDLNAQIKTVDDTLTDSLNQTRAQISRQQQVILQQQEALNSLMAENTKLTAAANAAESALRQERQTRAYETASLRGRVRALELLNHPEQ